MRHKTVVGRLPLDERQQGSTAIRVVQAVVHQTVRGLSEQEALVPVGRVLPRDQRHLVVVDRSAIGVADLHDQVPEKVGQLHVPDDAQAAPGSPLAREPALPG